MTTTEDDAVCNQHDAGRRGDWMQTKSGKRFYPIDPRAEDVELVDIAHALSMICRFTGHTKTHYSVAQHSVLVSQNVSQRAALWGLLHDAAEAYIGDLSRPLKRCLKELFGTAVKDIEDKISDVIVRRFLVIRDEKIDAEVKRADDLLLVTEARDFMAPLASGWRHVPENGFAILPERISPWTPVMASYEFMKRFHQLTA